MTKHKFEIGAWVRLDPTLRQNEELLPNWRDTQFIVIDYRDEFDMSPIDPEDELVIVSHSVLLDVAEHTCRWYAWRLMHVE